MQLTMNIQAYPPTTSKSLGKKYIVGDTGAGYAGKMLSMAAKKFGLKCKIFMGAKDIKRQRPNVLAMKKNHQLNCHLSPVFERYISTIWTATHSPLC